MGEDDIEFISSQRARKEREYHDAMGGVESAGQYRSSQVRERQEANKPFSSKVGDFARNLARGGYNAGEKAQGYVQEMGGSSEGTGTSKRAKKKGKLLRMKASPMSAFNMEMPDFSPFSSGKRKRNGNDDDSILF